MQNAECSESSTTVHIPHSEIRPFVLRPQGPKGIPCGGVTLLELMAALAILSLLLALARPALDGFNLRWRLRAAAHQVENVVRLAQNAAATRGCAVQVLYDVQRAEFFIRVLDDNKVLGWHKLPEGVTFRHVRFASGLEVTWDVAAAGAFPDGTLDAHEVLIEGPGSAFINLVFDRLTGDVSYEEGTGNPSQR